MTHDDAREQAELLARVERRVERLERRGTTDLTPLILRLSLDTAVTSETVLGESHDVERWLWNSDDAAAWNEDVLGPANVNREVVETAGAADMASAPAPSTVTETAGAADEVSAAVEDAPAWTWDGGDDGDGTGSWNETLYDD